MIFSWPYKDIPSLDKKFITHSLEVKNDTKPAKQKSKKRHPATTLLVNKEIDKYLKKFH